MSRASTKPPRQFVKTKLLQHQTAGLRISWGRKAFANLCEQGTGKSLMILAEALAMYDKGIIDALFILAPNGVHTAWVLEQCAMHCPDDVAWEAAYYVSTPTRKEKAALERLRSTKEAFHILAMSYDSTLTAAGFKFAEGFLRSHRAMICADESQRLKSPKARRAKRAMNLRRHCEWRRISTGTPITNAPVDAFSQFEFLQEGMLGEDSYRTFVAHYAHIMPPTHGTMQHIYARLEQKFGRPLSDAERAKVGPQIVAQDEMGRPRYKNLEELQRRIAEHSYRVLKKDVLDLPPKLYKTLYFSLTPRQRKAYDLMEEEYRYLLEDGTALYTSRLVAMGKLRQLTSGFMMLPGGSIVYLEDNPRIEVLRDNVEDETQQGIVWSQYKEEQVNIRRMFTKLGQGCEVVNGDVAMKRRREIRDEFQGGKLQWIAAHPGAMGTGYTLTAAQIVYYYSNGFNLEERIQSEDRTHRIGTVGESMLYRDIAAIDTRDVNVCFSLQHKLDTAALIQGDPSQPTRFGR